MDVDILIIGSGAGALTSAITAQDNGANVLVVEKTDLYGGTSATSGGGLWIPNNHLMAEQGQSDTKKDALSYLTSCAGKDADEARIKAYIDEAPKMIKFLDDNSHVKFVSTPYADYFPEKEGSKDGWRTLDPLTISASSIGKEFFNLRPPHPQTVFWGFTITVNEARIIITRAKGWVKIIMKLMLSYWLDIPFRLKTKRHRRLALGNALLTRCLKTAFERNIPIWRNTTFKSLVVDKNVVKGAVVEKDGKLIQINAAKGVVLAAGGFEHNQKMREKYLPKPTDSSWSATPGDNKGESIEAAVSVGADVSLMDAAWWGPAIRLEDEDRARILFAERALPGLYIINQKGKRFMNEASSYDEVGRILFEQDTPAWLIFDATARQKYPVGPIMPASAQPDKKLPASVLAVMKKAKTIEELATMIKVPLKELKSTIKKVNAYSETGDDKDFAKGHNIYDRYYSDPTVKPNPCLAPVEKAPFYAFPIYPGDIGTKGGLTTNKFAQCLDKKGGVIKGLYAIGNNSASITGHAYPGAGATLGPAMTFGYVAAKHMTKK